MKEVYNKLEDVIAELEKCIQEFEILQQITYLDKQGKIKLSDEKLQKLEKKYAILAEKMEKLNKRAKDLKGN